MEIKNYYKELTRIYSKLQDDESRALFEARISYLFTKNQDLYMEDLEKIYHDWNGPGELAQRMKEVNPAGIIIYGCGYGGTGAKRILKYWGYEPVYFCETCKSKDILDGIPVLSVDEVVQDYKDYFVIVCSYRHGMEMYQQLMEQGFPKENVYMPVDRILEANRGKQYFDVFAPQEEECFIDAGAFDGQTVIDFVAWTDGRYKKVYAFEPIPEMCNKIKKEISDKKLSKIDIVNGAAWDKNELLYFSNAGAGSAMEDDGSIEVQGVTIDSVVGDEKVTFLKMDIEGSELKALEGAKETILRDHPRLAICIYHKPEDVIEIPSYILSLVPTYKFYIRHYTSQVWETVLYAVRSSKEMRTDR